MPFGWVGKLLEVNLTTGEIGTRDTMRYAADYIGGRGLAARVAWDGIPPEAGPFDPENRVIVMTGPLTGTLAPTTGRTVMTGISPRTYPRPWYTHSTIGGWFGPELKYAGYDGIILWGRSPKPVYLVIRDGVAKLEDAAGLWGQGARETQLALRGRVDSRAQVLAIGPAGENLVRFATVQHAEENAAGHSGFGAVWGSKNLKAIAVRGTGGVTVARPDELLREVIGAGRFNITPAPAVLGVYSPRDGKNTPKPICTQSCTFDCHVVNTYGRAPDGRRTPGVCIGGVYLQDRGVETTEYRSAEMTVPQGVRFGVEKENAFHQACNNLGLDLWFRLVMQPWLIRCTELGIREIRGFPIAPDDADWFLSFTGQLARREGLGAVLADDLRRAMDELEGELPDELIRLGRELEFNFGFPAHREGRFWDEEPLPFWVISAMMHISASRDPTIGTHQSSLMYADFLLDNRELARRRFRVLSEKVWGDPDALEPTFENKAPVAIWSQNQHMLIDCFPICDFGFPQIMRPLKERRDWEEAEDISGDLYLHHRLFRAVTGVELADGELTRIAERAFNLERALLARAGRGRAWEEALGPHFRLPCRADGTSIDAEGFARLLDEYYAARGWDLERGWPETSTLDELGLPEVAAELQRLRRA
mgnify:CR=1 FL=1